MPHWHKRVHNHKLVATKSLSKTPNTSQRLAVLRWRSGGTEDYIRAELGCVTKEIWKQPEAMFTYVEEQQ